MKIAIFHNFLDNIGGAEIVGLTLARELGADVYSTNIDHDQIERMGFKDVPVYSIGAIPINAPWRQQAALHRFRHLDLRGKYDFFIIDGDWAMSGAVLNKPNLWYVHSPIREIWDLYRYTRQNTVPWYGRWAFDIWVQMNRHLNRTYVSSVDYLACNSLNTQTRVKKYLGRDATVIYPPIETHDFSYTKSGDFWLSVNRLISHKRVELQMEAFRAMPEERLIIVGSYEDSRHFLSYAEHMKEIKPDNVEIRSWVSQTELQQLYATCRGFIATAHDEDFGMTVVEAMAAGKPIVAADEGGYRESVVDGETGALIVDITAEKIVQAIKRIGKDPAFFRVACIERAKQFDTHIFVKKVKEIIGYKES